MGITATKTPKPATPAQQQDTASKVAQDERQKLAGAIDDAGGTMFTSPLGDDDYDLLG